MISWSVLNIVMFCIAMFAGIMPGVQWWMRADYARAEVSEITRAEVAQSEVARSCAHQARDWCRSCYNKAGDLKLAYDELFSYERGRYFMLAGLVMEIVEVIAQTSSLEY